MVEDYPRYVTLENGGEYLGLDTNHGGVVEVTDESVGCDVEEWYPEFEVGYYAVDKEFRQILGHRESEAEARALALGYEHGRPDRKPVPLFDKQPADL